MNRLVNAELGAFGTPARRLGSTPTQPPHPRGLWITLIGLGRPIPGAVLLDPPVRVYGGRDSPVPGSFAAPGIGAIDAVTGKAIRTWNPGRTRGVGIEELVPQPEGLYLGCDTERLAGELRARVGLFPLR